ncbi:MAG: hypothetical protein AB7D03_08515 [Thiomicrospira sp.]
MAICVADSFAVGFAGLAFADTAAYFAQNSVEHVGLLTERGV